MIKAVAGKSQRVAAEHTTLQFYNKSVTACVVTGLLSCDSDNKSDIKVRKSGWIKCSRKISGA